MYALGEKKKRGSVLEAVLSRAPIGRCIDRFSFSFGLYSHLKKHPRAHTFLPLELIRQDALAEARDRLNNPSSPREERATALNKIPHGKFLLSPRRKAQDPIASLISLPNTRAVEMG